MVYYSIGNALPLPGSTGPLLVAAIGWSHPTTLTQLAREAGISKFAASRAAAVLVEHQMLAHDEDGYSFNDRHFLAPTLVQLAWRLCGVTRRSRKDGTSQPTKAVLPIAHKLQRYQTVLPEWVVDDSSVEALAEAFREAGAGPDLIAVRDLVTWSESIGPELRGYESRAKDVYYRWHTERLRDVVHQTLHFGDAVRAASRILATAGSHQEQGGRDPRHVFISPAVWLRATYLLSAEVADMLRVIRILERAIDIGGQINDRRDSAISWLEAANSAETPERATVATNAAREDARQAYNLWTEPQDHTSWNIGGTPRPRDVGTAGDQALLVQLLETCAKLTTQVAHMANQPCVEAWQAANPVEVKKHPLITQVDDERVR